MASALLEAAQAMLAHWRQDDAQTRVEHALEGLDGRTLRDLGFGEFATRREAALWADVARARW